MRPRTRGQRHLGEQGDGDLSVARAAGSYHGNTFGAMSVAGSEHRRKSPRLLPNCHKIKPPLDDDALDRIETRLKRRDVAAFIMEPVSINLGVCVPEPGFMEGVRALCTRYRTLLILDEVARGLDILAQAA